MVLSATWLRQQQAAAAAVPLSIVATGVGLAHAYLHHGCDAMRLADWATLAAVHPSTDGASCRHG